MVQSIGPSWKGVNSADISFSVEHKTEQLSMSGLGNRNTRHMYWNRNAWNNVSWNGWLGIKARQTWVTQQTRKGPLILNILNTQWQHLSHSTLVTLYCPPLLCEPRGQGTLSNSALQVPCTWQKPWYTVDDPKHLLSERSDFWIKLCARLERWKARKERTD